MTTGRINQVAILGAAGSRDKPTTPEQSSENRGDAGSKTTPTAWCPHQGTRDLTGLPSARTRDPTPERRQDPAHDRRGFTMIWLRSLGETPPLGTGTRPLGGTDRTDRRLRCRPKLALFLGPPWRSTLKHSALVYRPYRQHSRLNRV